MMQASQAPLSPQDIEAYLLGVLPDERVEMLDRELRGNVAAVKQLAQAMQVMSLVRQEFAGQAQYQAANHQEPLLEDFNTLLKDLGEREAAAEPITLPKPFAQLPHKSAIDPDQVTVRDLTVVGGYVLRKTLTSKPAMFTALGTLAAAVLLLALILINPFASNAPDPQEIADNTPPTPDESAPQILRDQTVATLTATHNAVWSSAGGASAPPANPSVGTPLHPNTRLTLTAGFAEITTEEGAVVILEAPATVELLNNDNAIHLHEGKVVGLCHTSSSKGFVVKTDHADIVDLGTEFGVEVSGDKVTATVFTGMVQVTTQDGNTQPLTSNQTATLDVASGSRQWQVKQQATQGFARALPSPKSGVATAIAIVNPSFEQKAGWSSPMGDMVNALQFRETRYPNEIVFGYPAPDGDNVIFAFASEHSTSQVLTASLAANTTYTLQMDVVHGAGDIPVINSLLILGCGSGGPSDGTELARIVNGDPGAPVPPSSAPSDRIRTWTLTYTTGESPAGEGQPLWIQLGADGSSDTGRAGYDNIGLYAKPIASQPDRTN